MNIFEGSRRIAKLFAALIVVGFGVAIFTAQHDPVSVSYLVTGPGSAPVRVDQCVDSANTYQKNLTTRSDREVLVLFCFKEAAGIEPPKSKGDDKKNYWVKAPNGIASMVTSEKDASADWIKNLGKTFWLLSNPDFVNANDATKQAIHNKYALDQFVIYSPGAPGQFDLSTAKPVDYAALAKKYGGVTSKFDPDADLAELTPREMLAMLRRIANEKFQSFKIPEADEGYITRSAWLQVAKGTGVLLLQMFATLAGFWAFTWTIGWVVRGFMGIPRGQDRKA